MQKLSVVVFVVLLLAGLGWWLLGTDGVTPPDSPAATGQTEDPTRGATRVAGVGDGTTADDTAKEDVRVAVETDPNTGAGPGNAIVGRVLDADGKPLADATVVAWPSLEFGGGSRNRNSFDFANPDAWRDRMRGRQRAGVTVTTGADGAFRLVAAGDTKTVDLRVAARGFLELDRNVERPRDAERDVGTLQLQLGAVVTGRVIDQGGNPIRDARVSRSGRGGSVIQWGGFADMVDVNDVPGASNGVTTDAEGRFEFAHMRPGEFGLRARHEDHPTGELDGLKIAAGETLADLMIVVEPGAVIRGQLIGKPDATKRVRILAAQPRDNSASAEDSGPIAMIFGDAGGMLADGDLGFGERSAEPAADGTFELRGLYVGKPYRVWAAQSGRGFAGTAICSPKVDVVSGATGVQLRYEPGVDVTVTVVDAKSGAPIERLWINDRLVGGQGGIEDMISFATRGGGARDYPDGEVTLASLRPKDKQKLDLTIEALGFAKFERKGIELPTSGALDLGTVRLAPAPVVRVEVTAAGGTPIAGADVRLNIDREVARAGGGIDMARIREQFADAMGAGRSGSTDDDGRCVVNVVPNIPFNIAVTAEGFAPYQSSSLTVGGLEGLDHAVRMLIGGRVEVTVLDADGQPAAETNVDHRGANNERSSAKTDAAGVAVFTQLAPGEHRFRLSGRGGIGINGMNFQIATAGGPNRANAADSASWETVTVADGATASVRLQKSATASLSGIVRENGVPLAGARVSFLKGPGDDTSTGDAANGIETQIMAAFGDRAGGRGANGRTDDAGRYRLENLTAGEHRLRITHRDRTMPTTVRIGLQTGENTFDVDLDATIVRGTVRAPDGKPVADATVRIARARSAGGDQNDLVAGAIEGALGAGLLGGGSSVKTDADGRYELRGVLGGERMAVAATAKGYSAGQSESVIATAGAVTEGVDVQLGASGSVKVRAADVPAFASVQATWDGPASDAVPPVIKMLQRGSATVDGLRPGRWKLTLLVPTADMSNPQTRTVDVAVGVVAEVDF